jgi:hypothetical protein
LFDVELGFQRRLDIDIGCYVRQSARRKQIACHANNEAEIRNAA